MIIRLGWSPGLAAVAGTLVLACSPGCAAGVAEKRSPDLGQAFKDYWYGGEAELSRYSLRQSRYGEVHEGHAVLIFVTEDFRTDTQVKYESGERGDDVVSVLKLNATRKFLTGIYPYSTMVSVFAPVDSRASPAFKVSSSIQEWCGHTYQQLNYRNGGYEGRLHSYFQDEADREFRLSGELLEDALWTAIRLDPDALPVGSLKVVPGLLFTRLRHQPTEVRRAVAELSGPVDSAEGPARAYTVRYTDTPRTVVIRFEAGFPHGILGWEERYEPSGGVAQVTTARRTHTMRLDYWNKNSAADVGYRDGLGLSRIAE